MSTVLQIKEIPSLDRLTKYEAARIKATRCSQIQNGAQAVLMVDGKPTHMPTKGMSVDELVEKELLTGSIPMIVGRKISFRPDELRTVQNLLAGD